LSVCRPDSHTNKAVADGAVSFYIDHLVSTRTARFSYGIKTNVTYDETDYEHRIREYKRYTKVTGVEALPCAFSTKLAKGESVSEAKEFSNPYGLTTASKDELYEIGVTLLAYRGPLKAPSWVDENKSDFSRLCKVLANTSVIARDLEPITRAGSTFYNVSFDVIILFGLTELQAQIRWLEKGVEKRSLASIVYDDNV